MQDTCDPTTCPFAKEYGQERCPNYMETWWVPEEKGEPVLVKDCAPKRSLMMLQQMHNRVLGVQQEQAEVCGQLYKMTEALRCLSVSEEPPQVDGKKIIAIED